jgi:ribulose-phosphate 3-epimerase
MGWIEPFVEAGADIIIFCFDSVKNPGEVLRAIRSHGKKAGVSILLTESVGQLEPHWPDLDIVTFCGTAMGIKGASMDPACLEKTRQARAIIDKGSLPVELESDGGIRRETVPLLKAAGADFIVPGSLMFKEEPKQMRQWLAGL